MDDISPCGWLAVERSYMYRPTIRVAENIGSVIVVLFTLFCLAAWYKAMEALFNVQ